MKKRCIAECYYDIHIDDFLLKFKEMYAYLYECHDAVDDFQKAVTIFDTAFRKRRPLFVGEFCKYRGDYISSDREAAAFVFALNEILSKDEYGVYDWIMPPEE